MSVLMILEAAVSRGDVGKLQESTLVIRGYTSSQWQKEQLKVTGCIHGYDCHVSTSRDEEVVMVVLMIGI